jgi:hypothetical protein
MSDQPPPSVGLGGDGDEIAAIREVEAAFRVKLDYRDAPNWRTAGDVYQSLCKALPVDEADKADLWARFAEALTRETGVDPKIIQHESMLLSQSAAFWGRIDDAHALLFILVAIGVAIGAGVVLL